jgi:hypothetical protein
MGKNSNIRSDGEIDTRENASNGKFLYSSIASA